MQSGFKVDGIGGKELATQPITWFAETTGMARETVKKRLQAAGLVPLPGPHGAALYETPSALAAIYQQPANNQAALAAAKIANLEADTRLKGLREAREKGDLLPADLVARVWAGMTGACRAHLLAMPYRFMLAAQSANCPAAVEGAARNLILEALENISAYDPADYAAEPAQPDR